MRRLAIVAVVVALISPMVASGQDYSFGDWARDQGYEPGDVMPMKVDAGLSSPAIDNLNDTGEFDWTTTPTDILDLSSNHISSIESGDFSGLTNLGCLDLGGNQITSIESGDFSELTNLLLLDLKSNRISSIESGSFSGLTNLLTLHLYNNQISSIESGDFSGLTNLLTLSLGGNQISSIEPGDFSGLPNLTSLRLGSNRISSIESGDFSELTNLTGLHLGWNQISSIDSGDLTGLTNLRWLDLGWNQISSIDSGDLTGLTNLRWLALQGNQLTSIESGAFSELVNLEDLRLRDNATLTALNLEVADFSSLLHFDVGGTMNIGSVSLDSTVLNQTSLVALMDGPGVDDWSVGVGELDGITEMDLSGIDFANITDLGPLYAMDDLTDLWLVDTQNVDATDLDVLLDNLETIEGAGTEGILHMTQTDYDAFNVAGGGLLAAWDSEPGHHVAFVSEPLLGDVNLDGEVNGLDVDLFVEVLLSGPYQAEADMNEDQVVNGLDVDPFVAAVVGGTQQIPEPSTLLLVLVALALIAGCQKWGDVA